ncbi:pilin [Actinomadura sp. RB99]|uniref:pilin n=1 Tax=Actinomadura sp. RB99 TaxID=2691577 RepID=UPI001F50F932|nr:pilin [Actinomadura sp. RB99]
MEGSQLSVRPFSDLLSFRRPRVSKLRLVVAVLVGSIGLVLSGSVLVVTVTSVAQASAEPALLAANAQLVQVINNLRNVIVGLLIALATLFATIGGVRYLLAGGDPSEAEAGKRTLRNAAIGYGIAALAPVLVQILQYIVGS